MTRPGKRPKVKDVVNLGHLANASRAGRRKRQRGQSLVEYSLLLAMLALATIAILDSAGKSSSGIWSAANSQLSAADSSLSPSSPIPTGNGDHHHDGHGDGGH